MDTEDYQYMKTKVLKFNKISNRINKLDDFIDALHAAKNSGNVKHFSLLINNKRISCPKLSDDSMFYMAYQSLDESLGRYREHLIKQQKEL